MNLKNLFTIASLLMLIYGVMDVFMPGTAYELFGPGAAASSTLITVVQLLGTSLIGMAILMWFMRDAQLSYGRRAALFGLTFANLASAVVQIIGINSGALNSTNWVGVGLSLVFGLAFGYYANKEHKAIIERDVREKAKA